jgi:hypothetical protein
MVNICNSDVRFSLRRHPATESSSGQLVKAENCKNFVNGARSQKTQMERQEKTDIGQSTGDIGFRRLGGV